VYGFDGGKSVKGYKRHLLGVGLIAANTQGVFGELSLVAIQNPDSPVQILINIAI